MKKPKPKPAKKKKPGAPKDNIARDTAMFVYHVEGHTYNEVAAKFNMSEINVKRVAKRYDWAAGKKEYAHRLYSTAMTGLKRAASIVMRALERDAELLHADAVKGARQLTKEERSHFLAYMDRVLKEVRLEDGKPTEHTTGVMTVEVQLPPGVKHYGLVPPNKNVKYVKAEDVVTRPALDYEAVDAALMPKETAPNDPLPSKPSSGPEVQPKEGSPGPGDTAGVSCDVVPEAPGPVQRREADDSRLRRSTKKRKSPTG